MAGAGAVAGSAGAAADEASAAAVAAAGAAGATLAAIGSNISSWWANIDKTMAGEPAAPQPEAAAAQVRMRRARRPRPCRVPCGLLRRSQHTRARLPGHRSKLRLRAPFARLLHCQPRRRARPGTSAPRCARASRSRPTTSSSSPSGAGWCRRTRARTTGSPRRCRLAGESGSLRGWGPEGNTRSSAFAGQPGTALCRTGGCARAAAAGGSLARPLPHPLPRRPSACPPACPQVTLAGCLHISQQAACFEATERLGGGAGRGGPVLFK
jgi:hypothetical protein